MTNHRPTSVTIVCTLAAIGGLIDLVLAQRNLGDYETAQWVEAHPRQAQFEQFYLYVHAGITLLASYFMLQGHNWARWVYFTWNAVRIAAAGALQFLPEHRESWGFLTFRYAMIPGALFFLIAVWLLSRAEARDYFAFGRKQPWRD